MTGPCAVYRVWSPDQRLLYIGCSPNPLVRAYAHARGKAWATDMATITMSWFPDRKAARIAEAQAIAEENPEWNVHYNAVPKRARGIFHHEFDRHDRGTWDANASRARQPAPGKTAHNDRVAG